MSQVRLIAVALLAGSLLATPAQADAKSSAYASDVRCDLLESIQRTTLDGVERDYGYDWYLAAKFRVENAILILLSANELRAFDNAVPGANLEDLVVRNVARPRINYVDSARQMSDALLFRAFVNKSLGGECEKVWKSIPGIGMAGVIEDAASADTDYLASYLNRVRRSGVTAPAKLPPLTVADVLVDVAQRHESPPSLDT